MNTARPRRTTTTFASAGTSPQPQLLRPAFAAHGQAVSSSSLTFLPRAAIDAGVPEHLGLQKTIRAVSGCRDLRKKDMVLNNATPEITVDPQTYRVAVDGEDLTCDPVETLPMAQRYFLF